MGWGYMTPIIPIAGFFGFTCPAVACSYNHCNSGVFHVS